jgi:hypothetical protein
VLLLLLLLPLLQQTVDPSPSHQTYKPLVAPQIHDGPTVTASAFSSFLFFRLLGLLPLHSRPSHSGGLSLGLGLRRAVLGGALEMLLPECLLLRALIELEELLWGCWGWGGQGG